MAEEKTRYDVLLAQIEYIKNGGRYKKFNSESDGNDPWINVITNELAAVCIRVDDSEKCLPPCRLEDGMCICD